ncbi:hypothetical protein M422DRAFT_63833, partial [Sphaerobolus stellatus SS14]
MYFPRKHVECIDYEDSIYSNSECSCVSRFSPGPGALTAKLLTRLGERVLQLATKGKAWWRLSVIEDLVTKQSIVFLADVCHAEMMRIYYELEDLCCSSIFSHKMRTGAINLVIQITYMLRAQQVRNSTGKSFLQSIASDCDSAKTLDDLSVKWKNLLCSCFTLEPFRNSHNSTHFTPTDTSCGTFQTLSIHNKGSLAREVDELTLTPTIHSQTTSVKDLSDSYETIQCEKRNWRIKDKISLRHIKKTISHEPQIFSRMDSGPSGIKKEHEIYQTLWYYSRPSSPLSLRKQALKFIVEILCLIADPSTPIDLCRVEETENYQE